ncbi:MAG: glycosyltransferase [Alicyclobacillaceae bacterium]|nr:glycosyltransferase [Alicyclobacillaceae bacterium]
MRPAISVYMTVKNGGRWVRFAVESIQNQTFQEWEFIIVDDGSTDDTPWILNEFEKNDSRIRVVLTEGIGRGAALNLALSQCQADYVANLDADDLSHPQRLELQYEKAQENPHYVLFCSRSLTIHNETDILWPRVSKSQLFMEDVTNKIPYFNPINHSSVFARREALLSVGGYDQNLMGQFDYDLWVRLAEAGHRLGRFDAALVAKRWHEAQSFEAKNHVRYVLSSLGIQARAIRALRAGLGAWAFLGGRLAWGLLPRQLRVRVRGWQDD